MFNNHYKNIVEKTSGIAPERLGVSSLPENDEETIKKKKKKKKKKLDHFENYPSVSKI